MEAEVALTINMNRFGLSYTVPTDLEQVNDLLHQFDSEPDESFGGGKGKAWLCEQMEGRLSVEDDYFAEDTLRQIEEPERWRAFLTACVAYACLVCYLNEVAVPLDID